MTQKQKNHTEGNVQLLEYLYERDISQAAFARKSNISQSSISKYISGLVTPSVLTALRIEEITEGAVSCADWASLDQWLTENIHYDSKD